MIVAATMNAAPIFHTQRLKAIAKAAHMQIPATLESNKTYEEFGMLGNRILLVETNAQGSVSHIGYKLFAPEFVEASKQRKVLRFVERYILELDLGIDEYNRSVTEIMSIDNVQIAQGSWSMFKEITPEVPFTITEIKRRGYSIAWQLGEEKLEILFPADCQLILGADQPELESMFCNKILQMDARQDSTSIGHWEEEDMTHSNNMWIVERGKYLSDLIRGDIYLVETENGKELYCSSKNLVRSVSNIMLTGIFKRDIPMQMEVNCYGARKDTIQTTLQKFVSLCREEGCELYFGIKAVSEQYMSGTLFALNNTLGYNHMLSIVLPTDILENDAAETRARCYVYIPLQNVTEEFFNQDITKRDHE